MGRRPKDRPDAGPLARNVRRLRVERGMSQQRLAELAAVSRVTVVALEKGREADLSTLDRLAAALGVTIPELRGPAFGDARTADGGDLVAAFSSSPWADAVRPSEDELRWLRGLPTAVFAGAAPTPEMVAQLLLWRRSAAGRQ